MKTKKIFSTALISALLTSCAPITYFQVYKATPSEKLVVKKNLLVYEDSNCEVSYNLWNDGGDIGFQFLNKTEENIYLNMEESFFILNGVAHNYYRNRVFTNSANSSAVTTRESTGSRSITGINYLDLVQTNKVSATQSVGLMTSSGFSVSFNEEKTVCIPSKTSKVIKEYSINQSFFSDCDLFKYPTKRQIKSKTFTKEQSPLIFSNRIAYTLGNSDKIMKFENEFYVTEISNYPEREMVESKYDEYCGQTSMIMTQHFKNVSADKFYIRYTKGQDGWKH